MSLMEQEARESAARVDAQRAVLAPTVRDIAGSIARDLPALWATCARGSSDHAALFAKYLVETATGLPVMSASPSLVSVYAIRQVLPKAAALAISQSGRSPDVLAYLVMAREAGAHTIAIVNTPASPVGRAAQWRLPLAAGEELSVAATKSYICTLAAIVQLTAAIAGSRELEQALDELVDVLGRAAASETEPLTRFLAGESSCLIVGRGLGFAIAQEAALKLKETCGLHAEAISAAEVQHGPMALLARGVPVLFLIHGDATTESQSDLAARFAAGGAKVFVAGPQSVSPQLTIAEGASHVASAIGIIQTFYIAAARLASLRGQDPDRPPLLSKITETI